MRSSGAAHPRCAVPLIVAAHGPLPRRLAALGYPLSAVASARLTGTRALASTASGHTANKCAADEDASACRAGCRREDATGAPGRRRFRASHYAEHYIGLSQGTAKHVILHRKRLRRRRARRDRAVRRGVWPGLPAPTGTRIGPSGFVTRIGSLLGIGTRISAIPSNTGMLAQRCVLAGRHPNAGVPGQRLH